MCGVIELINYVGGVAAQSSKREIVAYSNCKSMCLLMRKSGTP